MDPDLQLINAMAQGAEPALRELMSRHKDALYRFAYRYTNNATDAGELTQETFVRAWLNARKFTPGAKVSTWLFSICANLCRDRARRQRRWQLISLGQSPVDTDKDPPKIELAATDAGPAEQTQLREEVERASAAVDALPYKLKAPFILCVLETHTHEQAAAILGTTSKAVETRIYRARSRLKSLLAPKEIHDL